MLEAANWAPTHGKTEPWRFVVLGRRAQEEMVDLTLKVFFLVTGIQGPVALEVVLCKCLNDRLHCTCERLLFRRGLFCFKGRFITRQTFGMASLHIIRRCLAC